MTLPPPAAAPPMPARAGAAPSLPVTSPVLPVVEATDAVEDLTDLAADADTGEAADLDLDIARDGEPDQESALESLGDLDEVAADVPAAAPAAPAAEQGRSLVLIEDGKVVLAPADVYVVDVTALTSPDRSADDLFEALKNLREVAPSAARDGLADRLTAGLRDRLAV